jgi:hypothetical protein
VPTCASKMRMLVPSFGAVLIGCHSNDMAPSPVIGSNAGRRGEVPVSEFRKGSRCLKIALEPQCPSTALASVGAFFVCATGWPPSIGRLRD